MNEQQTQELINAVVDSYEETESFKRTAAELHISTAKVRKALLTAGVWTNETAEEIQRVREEHESWSDQEIADHLHISLNAVQMYTPYKLGPYDPDNRGASATRMAEYRDRNRAGADVVDGNRRKVGTMIAEKAKVEDGGMTEDFGVAGLDDLSWYDEEKRKAEEQGLPFSRFRHNPNPNAMPHVDDQFYLDYRLVEPASINGRHPTLRAFRIRLEIETDRMSAEELEKAEKEYGVKTGWTRDLIVPSYIPLHHLHYVIQRAFGFENSADHVFKLLPSDFSSALDAAGGDKSLRAYCRLCGILFRFPQGNDTEIYWDDDYDGSKSVRTWLKDKYEGSWDTDAGTGYGYADNQYRIWSWLGDRVEDFHKYVLAFDVTYDEFYEKLKELGAPEEYEIGELNDAGIEELGMTQFPANNILESLTLEDLLTLGDEEPYFADDLEMAESELLDNLVTLEEARKTMQEAQEIYGRLEKRMKAGKWDEDVLLVKRWRETAKRAAELFVLSRGGAEVRPFTNEIVYLYDFGKRKGLPMSSSSAHGEYAGLKIGECVDEDAGAKWKIKIKLLEEYYDSSIYYSRNYTPSDASGVRFQNDSEHEAEMADRLLAMCHWKEKLEVTDSEDRWIRPENERDMNIELRPEQELLPEEREKIEKQRAEMDENNCELDRMLGRESKEMVVVTDNAVYKAVRVAMLERSPVCIGKEGTEPGEGYPAEKIRNTSIENLV